MGHVILWHLVNCSHLWSFSKGHGEALNGDAPPVRAVLKRTPVAETGTTKLLRANEQQSRKFHRGYQAHASKPGTPRPGREE